MKWTESEKNFSAPNLDETFQDTALPTDAKKDTKVPKCTLINGMNYSIHTNSSEIVLSAPSLVTEMLSPYVSWLHKPAIDQHCTLSIHSALTFAEKETQGVLWPLLSISVCQEQPLPTQQFSALYAKLCRTRFFGLFFNFSFNCQEWYPSAWRKMTTMSQSMSICFFKIWTSA